MFISKKCTTSWDIEVVYLSTLWTSIGIKPLSPSHTMWERLNLDSPSESILSNLATLLMGKERPRIKHQVPPSPCVSDGTFTLTWQVVWGIKHQENVRHDFGDLPALCSFPTGEPGDQPRNIETDPPQNSGVLRVKATTLKKSQRALSHWGREQSALRWCVLVLYSKYVPELFCSRFHAWAGTGFMWELFHSSAHKSFP